MKEIDWNKLQPYLGDNKKSFEELCYQIVSEEFKDEISKGSILTSIDDTGGGDGVEFYLKLPSGDVYGWQAKFFCRLNEGGRKEQIKQSLQTAYKKHPDLKKWFLCNQCNFTPDEKRWFENELACSQKHGEMVLPKNSNVKLIHWGDSEILNFLRSYLGIYNFFFSEKLLTQEWFKERYERDIQKSQIKVKYESKTHISTGIDDAIIKLLGGKRLAEVLEKEIEYQQVEMYAEEYANSISKLFSEDVESSYKEIQFKVREYLHDRRDIIAIGIKKLRALKQLIVGKDTAVLREKIKEFGAYLQSLRVFCREYYELENSDLCNPIKYLRDEFEEELPVSESDTKRNLLNSILSYFKITPKKREAPNPRFPLPKQESDKIRMENRKRREARDILFAPLDSLKEYAISSLEFCLKVFEYLDQNELHISGEAGMGKTHISFNIYEDQIKNQNIPAIYIFGKDINTNQPLENQLKDNLDIPANWSFDYFLGALEIAARANRTKIPIIIDGMNESTYWNSVWNKGLENLLLKIKQKYIHVALITTYRSSYEDQLFPNNYFDYKTNKDWWKLKQNVNGFEGLTWEAIQVYFDFYKIKLENHSNAIGYFRHPLHLKIFCETKNPEHKNEVKVSFVNEDLFEVFDEYIKSSNRNITNVLQGLDSKYNSDFTENKLLKLSEYIWNRNTRGMPLVDGLLKNDELRIFEGENLLIFRDWNKDKNKEEIQFTYDLLGGYFISKHLIKAYGNSYPLIKINSNTCLLPFIKTGLEFMIPESGTRLIGKIFSHINNKLGYNKPLLRFIKSKEFRNKLLKKKTEHPLFDDILRTISILFVKEKQIFLFDVLNDERAKRYSTESIFEINAKYIYENEKDVKVFLKKEFLTQDNKSFLFDLAQNIELDLDHPLNFIFWSDLLKELSITGRDLSWSVYIRNDNSYFYDFIRSFEDACKEKKVLTDRVHIAAKKIMWLLTTNIRKLRDEATRSLYYYSRKFPKEFLTLLEYSLDINDPYVSERMLATSYGLAMARQNDLKDDSYSKNWLPKYGRFIFDNLFSKDAKFATTHILARDYAKRTIDISLLHHPNLLNESEKELIKYPLKNYLHKNWGESEDRGDRLYRDGNAPMHMDFKNYTIGHLIKGRHNYDDTHNEYKKVLSQIYWRIYDLGYSLEKFSKLDQQIERTSYNHSSHENSDKTDRYGKKYSWIAFYEMAGYRSDLEMLKGFDDEDEFRISDVDIDPSFPIELNQYDLFNELGNDDLLGSTNTAENWYEMSSDLNTDKYIHAKSKFNGSKEQEWLLLKGTIAQKDRDDQTRDIHISINAVLVNEKGFNEVHKLITEHSDYTFEYIRNAESYYLFEGEIPWSDLMPENYSQEFEILYNSHDRLRIDIETTIFENSWESYHSDIIPSGETQVPSKMICKNLGLFLNPQTSDLYDTSGVLVSTTFKHGEGYDQTSTFTYIRKDYIEKYLKSCHKKILWVQWCEKRYFTNGVRKLDFVSERDKAKYRTYHKIIL